MTRPLITATAAPPLSPRFLRAWWGTVGALVLLGIPLLDLLLLSWRTAPSIQWIEGISRRKADAAARAGNTGRLLVVGGSSGFFSVDAELLEARLGLPACNLATHAGLGLRYLLQDARAVAHTGDTVLLYLEYAHYRSKPLPILDLERKALWTFQPARLLQLPWPEALRQIYGLPLEEYRDGWDRRNGEMAPSSATDATPRLYSMVHLGPRGDFRSAGPMAKPAPALEPRSFEPPRQESLQVLADFLDWCRRRKIAVVAARPSFVRWPGITEAETQHAYQLLEPFYAQARVPLLETRDCFALPAELFYDTAYHANAAGRRLISETLARSLATTLQRPPLPASRQILLLAEAESGGSRDLVLSGQPPPMCRFLSSMDLRHPLCVTPAQVGELMQSGHDLVYADPAVGRMLGAAGLSSQLIQEKVSTLPQWWEEATGSLVLMTQLGPFDPTILASAPSLPSSSFLGIAEPKAGLFGVGKWGDIHISKADSSKAILQATARAPWQRRFRYPADFAIVSDGAKGGSITIQGSPCVMGADPGLAVAVYDPAQGSVVKSGVFHGPTLVEWQLFQVQTPSP